MVFETVVLGPHESGITKELGQYDDNNGFIFRQKDNTFYVVVRGSMAGPPADAVVPQADWNMDRLDGSGPSKIDLDPTKAQILMFDYEWLGVGSVRFGFVIDGTVVYCHQFNHANESDSVYMSTPNLPLRYSIENDGTGDAADIETLCSTVISEGGNQPIGVNVYLPMGNSHIDANSAGTTYAVRGIRLKATCLGCRVDVLSAHLLPSTNDDFEWTLRLNPTVAGGLSYSDVTNSALQVAEGESSNPSTSTVTGGHILAGGLTNSGGSAEAVTAAVNSAIRLGSTYAGVPDEIVLCVMPYGANLNIRGALTVREIM